MIYAYVPGANGIERREAAPDQTFPEHAIWIDLMRSTAEERAWVEGALGIALPSFERMREIETSSRFYAEGDALFMAATIMAQSESPAHISDAISFILVRHVLVTLREVEPRPFATYALRLARTPLMQASGE